MNQDEVKRNLLSVHQWIRMLFMAGYLLAGWVLILVLLVTILVQTLIALITSEINPNLRRFGVICGVFLHQIAHFLVYGSDEKPFPFTPFPNIDAIDVADGEDSPTQQSTAFTSKNSATANDNSSASDENSELASDLDKDSRA